jgi:Glycosyltransferase family 92
VLPDGANCAHVPAGPHGKNAMKNKLRASSSTRSAIALASICVVLAGLAIAMKISALEIQGNWLLAGLELLLVILLGTVLFATQRALRRNEEWVSAALLEQGKGFAEVEREVSRMRKQVCRIERNEAVQRGLLEGKLWKAAIPLPMRAQIERKGYLSAVVVVKDEGVYLREWLEFHRLMGVEHVYIYDNGSSDDTEQVLSNFFRTGYVTRIPWVTFVRAGSPQKLAYAHALSNFGLGWRWMALIDADEFLFPTEADSLPSALTGFEHLPALAVYWRTFGFSGHEKRPTGLVIENFTMRAPFPPEPGVKRSLMKFKSIVDPSRVNAVVTPHVVELENGLIGAYTEDGASISALEDRAEHAFEGCLRINHYYTKSKEELGRKLTRGSGDGMPMSDRLEIVSRRIGLVEKDLVEDKTIQRFLADLRRAVAEKDMNFVRVGKG